MKTLNILLVLVLLVGITKPTKVNKTFGNKTFVATNEWQEIKEGQRIPKGLHVRINLETGKKEAKLLDEEEVNEDQGTSNANSLSVVPEDNNKEPEIVEESRGDGRISRELEAAMKKLPKELPPLSLEYSPEKIEEIKKKFVSYEELKKTFDELKDNFKTDAEIVTKLLKEYKNTTKADLRGSASSSSSSAAEIKASFQLQILQNLNNLLHQYDNALWFIDSNGLEEILLPLVVNETNIFLRIEAMRVLGSLTQNNPKAQVKVFETNFGSHLAQILLSSTNSEELSAAIFAFGALLRKFPYAQKKILSTSGSQALVAVLAKECDLKVKAKAATLISDVMIEQQLELNNLKANDDLNLELQYRELHFELWLQPHLYCETMDTLITSHFYSLLEQPDLMEHFLQSLATTKDLCYYLWPQSPQLRHSLLTIKNSYANSQDEFRLELLEQIKSLLKSLYLHDEL